jgi:FixJ family two-component response regulator
LLVTDVVMRGLNGPKLARELAVRRPETRTLFMSGYTNDEIVHQGVLDPSVAYVQKPFTPTGLLRKMREVLDTAG